VPSPIRYALARALPALSLLVFAACPKHSSTTLGKEGDACAVGKPCEASLVCVSSICEIDAPLATGCDPASPGSPSVSSGTVSPTQSDYQNTTDHTPICYHPPVRTPSYAAATPQDLGVLSVGTAASFDVPADTIGFSIVSQESGTAAPDTIQLYFNTSGPPNWQTVPNTVVPTAVKEPNGTVFYDDIAAGQVAGSKYSSQYAVYLGASPSAGAFTVANTSRTLDLVYSTGALPDGTWSVKANDWAYECPSYSNCQGGSTAGQYDLTVLTKPGPITSSGTIDVAVYLVTLDPNKTAANVKGSAAFTRFLGSLQTLLGRAGLCLGSVTVYDLPAWADTQWATIDVDNTGPCDALSQLFTISQPANAFHLFLVDDLTSANAPVGTIVAGVDGTIPGPSGVGGTVASGAAVDLGTNLDSTTSCGSSFSPSACAPDHLAYIAAHEAGHWLGLYHTTEAFGGSDPLDDTATCSCSCITNSTLRTQCTTGDAGTEQDPSFLTASDCTINNSGCGGGDNLMFWLYEDASVSLGNLSTEQGRVIRLNPMVH
jgi:hypothetical protein